MYVCMFLLTCVCERIAMHKYENSYYRSVSAFHFQLLLLMMMSLLLIADNARV